ncbi:MAG: hypothetical protein ACREHG_05245 [Candidatus Saccharimonadales bacterium]
MKKLLGMAVAAMLVATASFGQVPQQQGTYPQQNQPPTKPLPPQNQQNMYPQQNNNNNQHVLPQGNQNTFPQNQNVVPPPSSMDTTINPRSQRIDTGINSRSNRMKRDTTGRGTDTSGTYNPPRL